MVERFIPNGSTNGKRKKGWQKGGPGRPPGKRNKMTEEQRKQAALAGELPHEFLLRIMRLGPGYKLGNYILEFPDIIEAAKAAAPYYASRLATLHVKAEQKTPLVIQLDPEKLKDMTPDQLSKMLAALMQANSNQQGGQGQGQQQGQPGQPGQLMLPAATNPEEDIVDAELYERTLN